VFAGIVPHGKAFSGFGDDIVIIVASALVVSAAVERSSVVEAARSHQVTSVQGQVAVLVAAVTVLSAFVKSPFMRMT
jgi:di/tricarboxylate transporter